MKNEDLDLYPLQREVGCVSTSPAMSCSLDSGLLVVLIILTALLLCVAILLFYDFENVCEFSSKNNYTNMVREQTNKKALFNNLELTLWSIRTIGVTKYYEIHTKLVHVHQVKEESSVIISLQN